MQRLASQLDNMPVFAVHNGAVLGHIQSLLVNPDSLKTVALKIKSPEQSNPLYLLPVDIRHLDASKVIIDSHTGLSEAEELIRLKPFLDHPFDLIGASVVTQGGKKLGKVKDFTITADDFLVTKLYLKSRSLWRLLYDSHIINRSAIVDVKDQKTIVVKDSTMKLHKSNPSVLPAKG